MRVNELYASVVELGFEDSLEDIPAFFSAANRALMQINALRPLTAIVDVYHRRPENLIQGADHKIYECSGEVILDAGGAAKAYYIEVMGEGRYQIEAYNEGTRIWDIVYGEDFSFITLKARRGLIKDDHGSFIDRKVRIRLMSDYAFQYRNAALYKVVYSSDPAKIPAYEEYARYDLKDLDPDFIEVCDNPMVDAYSRLTGDYYFESKSILVLPTSAEGEIKIKYKKSPRLLTYKDAPEGDNTEIELDPELVQLMPLLVASYIWLDEGDGKAQYYLELYYRRAAEIEAKNRNREGAKYESVNGW